MTNGSARALTVKIKVFEKREHNFEGLLSVKVERFNCDYRQAPMGTKGFRENKSEDFLRLLKTKEVA